MRPDTNLRVWPRHRQAIARDCAYGEHMIQVVGALVLAFVVLLVVGGLTGRVKLRSCCGIADPRNDARMRGAFEDEITPASTADSSQRR